MGYLEDRRNQKIFGKPPAEKKTYRIPAKSEKKLAQEAAEKELRSPDGTDLQKWYAVIMEKEEGKCWETGEPINKDDAFGWHGSVAHVLPKDIFPSVATHPQNYMILKMWGGTHGTYDASWEKAAKMKVWSYAVKIFNLLYPLLTREEKGRLPEIITQEIRPDVYSGL